MITTEKTELVALIGYPVEHTKSPELFSRFEQEFAPNAVYVPFSVKPDGLVAAIKGLKAMGFRGANITAPYKHEVFKKARTLGIKLTDVAKQCQSVNCLYHEKDGSLWGTSTDYVAFMNLFRNSVIPNLHGYNVLVIGYGGVAKVVLQALWSYLWFGKVDFLCRKPDICNTEILQLYEKHKKSIRRMHLRGSYVPSVIHEPHAYMLSDDATKIAPLLSSYQVVINATPLGMFPNTNMSPIPDDAVKGFYGRDGDGDPQTVIDLIYNPPETKLLAQAAEKGCACVNGRMMFVDQFVESFRLWYPQYTSGCSKEELIEFATKELGWAK